MLKCEQYKYSSSVSGGMEEKQRKISKAQLRFLFLCPHCCETGYQCQNICSSVAGNANPLTIG